MKYKAPLALTVIACSLIALGTMMGDSKATPVGDMAKQGDAAPLADDAQALRLTTQSPVAASPEASQARASAPVETIMDHGARIAYNDAQDWQRWKNLYLHKSGRVIDTGNGGISHTEGQGYGMLLATHYQDQAAFDSMWGFTQSHMATRDDGLFTWRFDPSGDTPVTDTNAASDGDLLIAWALSRASETFDSPAYLAEAQRIARAIRATLVTGIAGYTVLLPGPDGFVHTNEQRLTVNPSYIIFPALTEMARIDPDPAWNKIATSGLGIIRNGVMADSGLPADWLTINQAGEIAPDPNWDAEYGYNAMRIPLYMIWGGLDRQEDFKAYLKLWAARDAAQFSAVTFKPHEAGAVHVQEPGYQAIPALVTCALTGKRSTSARPLDTRALPDEADDKALSYYGSTLALLTRMAADEVEKQCR